MMYFSGSKEPSPSYTQKARPVEKTELLRVASGQRSGQRVYSASDLHVCRASEQSRLSFLQSVQDADNDVVEKRGNRPDDPGTFPVLGDEAIAYVQQGNGAKIRPGNWPVL